MSPDQERRLEEIFSAARNLPPQEHRYVTDERTAKAFHVSGIPTMVVVDRNNIVRNVHAGASPEVGAELRAALDELLDEHNMSEPQR
jgi:hypothetical protein